MFVVDLFRCGAVLRITSQAIPDLHHPELSERGKLLFGAAPRESFERLILNTLKSEKLHSEHLVLGIGLYTASAGRSAPMNTVQYYASATAHFNFLSHVNIDSKCLT